ncbi:hypothetical protein [Bradyrhizobium diazoefficiens]|uniref:hypothetical protein n=1 Tax=Bradyrhizobium diazoefficiens TaxID=1355477 RepID=UPI001B43076D|nr:hypothetical protein [Bradyrhizobium japonicum]
MLGAFFDDSGTHDQSAVVAMGGLLGTEEQWDIFERRWLAQLKEPVPGKPPLDQFHLTPCRNARGEFKTYDQAQRDYVTSKFQEIILETGFVTVAVAADLVAWKELVVDPAVVEELGTPLEFCFFKCVETVTSVIRANKPGELIDIWFDKGTEDRLGKLAQMFRQLSELVLPEIERVGFMPVKTTVGLQGADMIAYETYLYGIECLRNPDSPMANAHFQAYVKRPLSIGLFARREHIEEFVRRSKETIARSKAQ